VTLLNPVGLLGLITLPVILALHMLRERKRTYPVSSLDLWAFLEVEVRGQKLRRIPFSWLLLCDLLIAVFLSLALAQPRVDFLIPGQSARHIIILLDVSTSMQATDILPARFSQAKETAATLVRDLGSNDIATLITFGAKPRLIGDTRVDSLQDLLMKIEGLQAGDTGNSLRNALILGESIASDQLPVQVYVLTDASFDDPGLHDSPTPMHWFVFGIDAPNQAVLNISVVSIGDGKFQVFSNLANFSGQESSRLATLIADGRPLHSTYIDLPPDSVVPQVWPFVTGNPTTLTVSLIGNDSLSEDDTASTAWGSGMDIRVVLVTTDAYSELVVAQVEKALQSIPNVSFRQVSMDDYSPADYANLAIFLGTIPHVWPECNVLLLDPPSGEQLIQIQENAVLINPPVFLDESALILAGLDFGGVRWGKARVLQNIPENFEVLAQTVDTPLYLSGVSGSVRLSIFLPVLSDGNLVRHPAFPIMLGNQVQQALQSPFPGLQATGKPVQLPAAGQYVSLNIIPPSGSPVIFNESWADNWEFTTEPGIYRFELTERSGKQVIHSIGINAGDMTESRLAPQEWSEKYQGSQSTLSDDYDEQLDLTPWLLALALLLLLLEAWLSWR
jgi:Ca-activated chloride channel homolog